MSDEPSTASGAGNGDGRVRRLVSSGARMAGGGRAGWSLAVELLQLASSSLVFLILVKFMTLEAYGELVALLALVFPALSVATIGTHFLLLRRTSQGESVSYAWNRAITVGFVGPVLAAAIMIAVRPLILPNVNATAYALVFIGNLPFYWMNELAVYLGVGTGRMKRAAQARFILVLFRFVALGWFAIWGAGSLVAWAAASTLSFVAGGIGAFIFVWRVYKLRPGFDRSSYTDLPEGIPFSANAVNEGLVDKSDQVLLTRFDHKEDAALYGLGARIIQFGYLPLRVLLRTFDAELFAAGKHGVRSALQVSRRMAVPGMSIAVLVGIGFAIMAPVLPLVAGEKYRDSVDVIRLLSVLPVIRMIHYLLGNTLSASDRQWWRSAATFSAVVANLSLNIWLLRDGTWRTAVATTFVSEVWLAILLAVFVWRFAQLERKRS